MASSDKSNASDSRAEIPAFIPIALIGAFVVWLWNTEGQALFERTRSMERQVATLNPADSGVTSLAWSPDGKRIAVGTIKGWLRMVDPATGAITHRVEAGSRPLHAVAWSNDGAELASSGQPLRVWTVATMSPRREFEVPPVWSLAVRFSSDGLRLISSGSEVAVWDAKSARRLSSSDLEQNWPVAAISADGALLAAHWEMAANWGIRIFDTATGKLLRSILATNWSVATLTFVDSRLLAMAPNRYIQLHDALTGEMLGAMSGHRLRIMAIACSRDGKLMATGALDQTVRIWDVPSRKEIASFPAGTEAVTAVTFAPDGRRLAFGNEFGAVRILDLPAGK